MSDAAAKPELKRSLSGLHLWALAVGLVISGEYFGWSYGWASAGTLGFLLTTVVVAVMYSTFIFSFTELTTAIPHAGGPFAYSYRAFGPFGGFVAGFATLIEFVFAPPAIALTIGAYINFQVPSLDVKTVAVGAYLVFMALNIAGVTIAATFELFITLLAIFELLVFMGVVAPGFSWANFTANGWAGSAELTPAAFGGIVAALPFAIWFFLAIEGAAMAAEETKNPTKVVPRAFIGGILTLVLLAFGVMIFAGGTGDWTLLAKTDKPLPEAMKTVVGDSSGWLHMLIWIGLFGLIASFHGIIMGYSRQIFAMSRAGFLPPLFAQVHPRLKTPVWAILAGGVIGIAAIFSDAFITIGGLTLTSNIVTMSVFGAILLYIMSMLSLFKLRKSEPNLLRPFKAPVYPLFPAIALVLALFCMVTMAYYNRIVFGLFVALFAVSVGFYFGTKKLRLEQTDAMLKPV